METNPTHTLISQPQPPESAFLLFKRPGLCHFVTETQAGYYQGAQVGNAKPFSPLINQN